jgi:hypothetical protein
VPAPPRAAAAPLAAEGGGDRRFRGRSRPDRSVVIGRRWSGRLCLVDDTFTNGSDWLAWTDASDAAPAFTVAEFKAFATTLGSYIGTLKQIAASNSDTLPSQPVTIP